MTRLWPGSLAGRLVAILVVVVVLTTALVATVTTIGMQRYLTDRLDQQVGESLARAAGFRAPLGDADDVPPGPPSAGRFSRGQEAGTLTALFIDGQEPRGFVVNGDTGRVLSTTALNQLADVPSGRRATQLELPGLGTYRVLAVDTPDGLVVAGLPTDEVGGAVSRLVLWEVLLGMLAVGVAAGAGRVLVNRQLRPLREVAATAHAVAELPLESGEIDLSVRVPEPLTDPRTEVGAVGSAMNAMLGHVEQALDARHRSEQQVRQFVADASHELRTPLSTIHGYAELTRRTAPADPAQLSAAMEKVEAEASRMSVLVDDLLLLARLDAGRPLERQEVDLTRLVLEAVADARVVSPDHRWELELPDEPVLVTGDDLRLHQVLTNLLANAGRHTPAGTTVTVALAQPTTGQTLLTVHDDGPGLSPELVGRAFERFTRGDTSRTRASGGSGLGLSLVRAITSAHHGTASVRSVPGDTVFTVALPTPSGS